MRALGRHATTLVLVALAIAAAVLVFARGPAAVSTDEAEHRRKNLIEAWRPDDITELTVTASGRTARLVRGEADGGGQRPWSVEIDGQRYVADEQAVDQYLGTLEFAAAERRVSDATDRGALGLSAPRITVALTMGPRRERLIFGGSAPTPPGAAYAEVSGRGVFVVSKQLEAALDVPPERFRTRRFVPYLSTELAGLLLDGEGGPRHLARAAWASGGRGAGFRFDGSTPEGKVRAQAEAVDRILTALGGLQAEVFLSDDEAERAAAKRVTVTLVPREAGAKAGVLEIGGACPGGAGGPRDPGGERVVAIRREPTRASACVPASALEALTAPAGELVDRSPVGAPLDEVTEVTLTEGDRRLELSRAEAEWHLRAPEDRRVPTEVGRALVQALLDVEATRVIASGAASAAGGLDPPRATVRIVSTPPTAEGAPGERVETLEIGAPSAGSDIVLVRRLEDGAVLEVPAATAGALLPGELSLRPVQVFDFGGDRVRSLRIEEGGLVQRLRRTEGGGWELLEPAGEGLRADLGLASDVAEVLGTLTASRWVSADGGGGYGLAAPRRVIEAEVAGEGDQAARTARVEIGAPTGAGSFARAGGGPAVFVAPPALEATAGRLLLDRSVFLVAPERVARITLAPERGAPVMVTASPGGWTIARSSGVGAGAPAASAEAAALAAGVRDALAGLTAEGAVSLGAPEERQGLDRPRLRVTVELTPAQGAAPRPIRIALGAGDAFRGTSVVYARRDGVAATYALAQAKIRPLFEAAGVR